MVEITNGTGTFTATADTQVQNVSSYEVQFQTDSGEEIWGRLNPFQILSVPSGTTVYFKANNDTKLATIEV